MKNITLILVCIFFNTSLFYAQTPSFSLKWGKEHTNWVSNPDIIGTDNEGFYAFNMEVLSNWYMVGKDHFYLKHYNTDLSLANQQELDLKEGKFYQDPICLFLNRERKLWLLTYHINKSTNQTHFYAQDIDKKKLKKNSATQIAETPPHKAFAVKYSSDSSKVLLMAFLKDDNNRAKFSLNVFSDNMEKLWLKEVSMPYDADLFDFQNVCVDNSGRILILGKLYKKRKTERKKGAANYNFVMLRFSQASQKPDVLALDLEGKFVLDIKVLTNQKGNYVCAGLYADKLPQADGTFFMEMSGNTGEMLEKSINQFSDAAKLRGFSEREQKDIKRDIKKDRQLNSLTNFEIKDFVQRKDGGYVFVAEQYYLVTYYTYNSLSTNRLTSSFRSSSYTIPYYGNLVVVNINTEGDISWVSNVPKLQTGSYAASYVLALVDNNIHIVFNDFKDNLKMGKNQRRNAHASASTSISTLVTINAAGVAQRKELFSNKKEDIYTVPASSFQISPNELILLGRKRTHQKFAKVTF